MTQTRYDGIVRVGIESLILILAICALIGCVTPSLTQVRQFASASKALGEQARSAFDIAAKTSVNRQLFDVAADPGRGPSDATFRGIFARTDGDTGVMKSVERLALRLRVLDQLTAYSNALLKLAEADFERDIDVAAKDLNGSLIGLRDTYKEASGSELPLTDDDFALITTAVNAIGKAVEDAKRIKAIKTTIVKADSAVQKATDLIASDLGGGSDLAGFVMQAMQNSRGSVQQAYNLERTRPSSTFEARFALLGRARELYDAESSIPNFFAAVSNGASAVGAAHSALRRAVEADDFSSAELAKRVGQLEVYVKSVQSFSESIRKAN